MDPIVKTLFILFILSIGPTLGSPQPSRAPRQRGAEAVERQAEEFVPRKVGVLCLIAPRPRSRCLQVAHGSPRDSLS
jgi:hypothetical protein